MFEDFILPRMNREGNFDFIYEFMYALVGTDVLFWNRRYWRSLWFYRLWNMMDYDLVEADGY